ncbi:zinc-binding dehydrogenase [Thalassotalea mangrovi]|uniref:Alcohol dehydrogenase n=1 Tax=Thalassotalea mangrovi TaxID=2572245 RepID=A0A4U1B744_9GAMM|nr:zinc-binding dehydrogenase [Thalassotalea mangrovi]TKB46321.1 alcohol dehydrogenase [Thalassotalea mangrovi]
MNQMQSVLLENGKLAVNTIDKPTPGPGQVLVKSLACGICGSDLHITRHTDEVYDVYKTLGVMDASIQDDPGILLGHEFVAEVVSYGPETKQSMAPGARVTCVPILMSMGGAGVGVTPGLYGAYSEYFLIDEALMLPVPDGVSSIEAATTEPLAVGLHAVNRSNIENQEVALVVGCGAIGLAAIAALKLRGVKHIIASEPRASRRQVALEFGATHVVDPTQDDEVALASQLADGQPVVIFECVGIHQLINNYIMRAPAKARMVITGIHTTPTEVNFAYATVKEMDISFSYYYTPEEFAQSLQNIAEGKIPAQKMCTGKVGIDGVADTFATLFKPNDHIKVVIEPWRQGALEMMSE